MDVRFHNYRGAIYSISLFAGKLKLAFNDEQHKNIMPTFKALTWSLDKGEHWADEPDFDAQSPPITNKQLAMLLAKGWSQYCEDKDGDLIEIEVPPRPMLKQFIADKGINELRGKIGNIIEYTIHDVMEMAYSRGETVDEAKMESYISKTMGIIGELLVNEFTAFVEAGSVYPSNAKYTIRKKGFDKPGVHTGDLLDNFDWSWEPQATPRGSHRLGR